MKPNILTNVTKTFYKASFQLKKHSPEILAGVGIVGTVASAVIACKATTKISGILADSKKEVDIIHKVTNNPEMAEKYSVEESKKDLTIVYAQTGLKLVKLYAPAVILGAASLSCLIKSNDILRKRAIATAAAYATVDKSFKEYRKRVADRFGEEVENEIRYNIKAQEIEETIVDEKGKEKTVKKTVKVAEPFGSDYTKCFCEGNPCWEKNAEYNKMFLNAQQAHANQLLAARGYVFLNEVYELLGFEPTTAGQIVGWLYDSEDGDGYVDFGVYDGLDAKKRDFVNGDERSVWLDFNPDGIIYEKAFGTHIIK